MQFTRSQEEGPSSARVAWRKQPEIWKSLEKGVEAALIPPLPPLPQRCRPAAAVRTAGRPCQETESKANT